MINSLVFNIVLLYNHDYDMLMTSWLRQCDDVIQRNANIEKQLLTKPFTCRFRWKWHETVNILISSYNTIVLMLLSFMCIVSLHVSSLSLSCCLQCQLKNVILMAKIINDSILTVQLRKHYYILNRNKRYTECISKGFRMLII